MRSGVLGAVLEQALAEARRQAAGQRDDALGVALDLGEVDAWLAPLQAFEEASRGELDEVAVADVVGGQEGEVVALHPPRTTGSVIVDEVYLAPDDRLDAVLRARLVKLDGAVHDAMIGESEGGLPELGGAPCQRIDLACAVEQGVLGVDVQVCAGGLAH